MAPVVRRLEGKVAVVTASTQGIGFAIAQRLGEEGASVVISSRKQVENCWSALGFTLMEIVQQLSLQVVEQLGTVNKQNHRGGGAVSGFTGACL